MKSQEELIEENKLLLELCKDQYQTLKFLNKIMFDTTKHQRSLSKEEQNFELLDLAWSTNDCIVDNPRQRELIEELKNKSVDITLPHKK